MRIIICIILIITPLLSQANDSVGALGGIRTHNPNFLGLSRPHTASSMFLIISEICRFSKQFEVGFENEFPVVVKCVRAFVI